MTVPAAIVAENAAVQSVPELLSVLIVILASAKILGELAERIGQPAVLGELLAGVLVGGSLLGVVDPQSPLIHTLAEIGVIVLLFEIGLETSLGKLLRVGGASAAVAAVGVVLPFGLGYYASLLVGLEQIPALVAAAALTATSIGITARVLSDLGKLQEQESQIILGAAVIDDVVGLIILAVVSKIVAGGDVGVGGIGITTLKAFGFLAGALLIGRLVVPRLFGLLSRLGGEDTLATMALVLAFVFAYLADLSGSALIIGAFAAGLVLQPTPYAETVEKGVGRLGLFFVPIFFVAVGAAVDVGTFGNPDVLLTGVTLIAVAIVGKFACGYAAFWVDARKSVIGVGMIPRGEVGLIFAQLGLTSGALSTGEFSALTLMVMVTTFMAPPLLKMLFPGPRGPARPSPSTVSGLATEA